MKLMRHTPNLITAGRFFLTVLTAVLLLCEQRTGTAFFCWLLFTLAAATDWVDGYLARRFEAVSTLGKLMDPLADKMLVATALILLIPLARIPAWAALVMLSRELFITGLRGAASAAGIVVAASGLGKAKSAVQYTGLSILIFPVSISPIPHLHELGLLLVYIALVLALWSGFDYFFKLRQLFFLEESGKQV